MSSSSSEKLIKSKNDIVKEVKIFFFIKRCSACLKRTSREFNYLYFLLLYYFLSVAKKISNCLQENTLGRRKRKKAASEAKKVTKEAINIGLKRKREEAKQGGPYLIKLNKLFISLYYIIDKYKAKSEYSTPNVAIVFHL